MVILICMTRTFAKRLPGSEAQPGMGRGAEAVSPLDRKSRKWRPSEAATTQKVRNSPSAMVESGSDVTINMEEFFGDVIVKSRMKYMKSLNSILLIIPSTVA